MSRNLDPELRHALAARIRYYNEMGIYDFYRRPANSSTANGQEALAPLAEFGSQSPAIQPELGEQMSPRKAAAVAVPVAVEDNMFEMIPTKPEQNGERSGGRR